MKIVPVIPVQGEARADSRDIAKALGNQHKSVLALIGEYQTQFQAFGVLPFETAKPTGNLRGGRPVVYALLNEDQCYFLLTLVRNSEKVVELKLHLVQAFGRLRRLDAPALDLAPLQQIVNLTAAAINASEQKVMAEIDQRIQQFVDDSPINHARALEIKKAIERLARLMGGKPYHFRTAWTNFKDRFQLPAYKDLPNRRFDEAMKFIRDMAAAYEGPQALEFDA